MGIARYLMQATIAAFITMIFIFIIKKATAGRQIPIVSTVVDGV